MMLDMFQLPFMMQALLACLLMAVVLSYFGVHVVTRGIVFIDLALAQISSAGVALAVLSGGDPRVYSIGFTLLGALAFSVMHSPDKRVPQEAMIGIIYAVASAVAILLLSKAPHADSDVTEILFGNILAVTPGQITEMAIVFGVIALVHLVFRKAFLDLSLNSLGHASSVKPSARNFLFYITLALVIAYAIRAAGVLLVFSYLIVPAVVALLMVRSIGWVFLVGMGVAMTASFFGLYTSYQYDLPTGAAIVTVFGLVFLLALGVRITQDVLCKRETS